MRQADAEAGRDADADAGITAWSGADHDQIGRAGFERGSEGAEDDGIMRAVAGEFDDLDDTSVFIPRDAAARGGCFDGKDGFHAQFAG